MNGCTFSNRNSRELRLYVKLILRSNCALISFHEDEGENDEEDT